METIHYFHDSLMNRFLIDINTIFLKLIALVIWCSGYFFFLSFFCAADFGGNRDTLFFMNRMFKTALIFYKVSTVTFDQCVASLLIRIAN